MILDSLYLYEKMTIANNIRNWLEEEWTLKNDPTPLPPALQHTDFPTTTPPIPQQQNGYNYGVYICKYTQGILEKYHNNTYEWFWQVKYTAQK